MSEWAGVLGGIAGVVFAWLLLVTLGSLFWGFVAHVTWNWGLMSAFDGTELTFRQCVTVGFAATMIHGAIRDGKARKP